jgi:hypothetical protein
VDIGRAGFGRVLDMGSCKEDPFAFVGSLGVEGGWDVGLGSVLLLDGARGSWQDGVKGVLP